jgi:hypothetical protein
MFWRLYDLPIAIVSFDAFLQESGINAMLIGLGLVSRFVLVCILKFA